WMAHRRRPLWSGALAGIGFWVSPKAVFVAAACALWYPGGAALMAAGFAAVTAAGVAVLWGCGALGPYWREVWEWGRLYAGGTFLGEPLKTGAARTANWMGFHIAAVAAAGWFLVRTVRAGRRVEGLRWVGWLVLALMGVAAGMRFFPRYYFLLLPVIVLMAARGFALPGRARDFVALLLLIPLTRFGPSYVTAVADPSWRDTAMDRDSRTAAAALRGMAHPGDTLFVWGYRPELYVYARVPAGAMFLDSQPLTGVPADRHLTQSAPIELAAAREHRAELAATAPTFVADGLSPYNPRLGIDRYPDLRAWFAHYQPVARTSQTVIYRRITRPSSATP
ncbi:MAG: hypothetical protein LAQ30_31880, partial [Acidobacteriia bacterium]|nr:hypothetical protein [Terriglobia bacterium]